LKARQCWRRALCEDSLEIACGTSRSTVSPDKIIYACSPRQDTRTHQLGNRSQLAGSPHCGAFDNCRLAP
jgi:hypothetical protein